VLVHRLFINEFSSSHVNEDPVFLHLGQSLSIHDPRGLTSQRKSQNYSVGFLEKLTQPAWSCEELDALCCLLLSGISVNLHSKSLCDSSNYTPDSAESKYSENFFSQHRDLTPFVQGTFQRPFLVPK